MKCCYGNIPPIHKNHDKLTSIKNAPKQPVIAPNKIGPYVLKQEIGSGGYSQVRIAFDEITGNTYACKIVPKIRLMNNKMEERFENEIRILQKFQHPGITKLFDLLKDTLNYYIILEYCTSGSLLNHIIQNKKTCEEDAKFIFKQICETLLYVHKNGIAHRDIKPENILMDGNMEIKLIDFGFSAFVQHDQLFSTKCGTPNYAAPEVITGLKYDGLKADVWSAGVVLYTLIFGQLPWTKINQAQLLNQISRGEYFIPMSVSNECTDIITKMMNINTDERLTIAQVLKHPWLQDVSSPKYLSRKITEVVSLDKVNDFFAVPTDNFGGEMIRASTSIGNTNICQANEIKGMLSLMKRRTNSSRKVIAPNLTSKVFGGCIKVRPRVYSCCHA